MIKQFLYPNDEETYINILREFEFCSKYSHKCLTKSYGYIKKNDKLYGLVYEYLCNGTLQDIIKNSSGLSQIKSLNVINRLFQGINYLYSNSLIHRDIKPLNILFDHDFVPYLSDFDTVRRIDEKDEKPKTLNIGSIFYSSPELDIGELISYPTDIYSFGLIIYFIFEKKHMFADTNDPITLKINDEILPINNVSNNLKKLYENCVKYSQNDRLSHEEIKEILIDEVNSFDYLERYVKIGEFDSFETEINQFIYDNIILQHENPEKWGKCFDNVSYFFAFYKTEKRRKNRYFSFDNLFGMEHDFIFSGDAFFDFEYKQRNSDVLFTLGEFHILSKNYLKAKKYFEMSASKFKNPHSFNRLGDLYYYGQGVTKDFIKAKEYYELSAQGNDSNGFINLGSLYYFGVGVEQNFQLAKKYYDSAADLGNTTALYNLGIMYLYGNYVKKDYLKAREYFEIASTRGYTKSILKLGEIYYNGLGVEENYLKAKEYFEELESSKEPESLLYLGQLYYYGFGVKQNYRKAKEYFEISAQSGDPDSIKRLGDIYYNGNDVKKDFLRAFQYYQKAAELNNSDALNCIGDIYSKGIDIEQDYLKAKKYYELAAEQNNPEALLNLGHLYYNGNGVSQNYKKAKKYFEYSAQLNNDEAFYEIGDLYFNGYGVNQDYRKAKQFYEYSAHLNNSKASYILGYLYSCDDEFETDFNKAIQYYKKCCEIQNGYTAVYNSFLDAKIISFKYNHYKYHSFNDIGLIYLIVLKNIEKSTENLKEAAFAEFPFGQNNFGLLCQFFLDKADDAEYMYERAAKHNFALAYYNLGYLNEKNGKEEKSIELYMKASENENEPLIFHNQIHNDKLLETSKRIIICFARLKIFHHFYTNSDFLEAKTFFIKIFSNLESNQFYINVKYNNIQDIILYIKSFILGFPGLNDQDKSKHLNSINEIKNFQPNEKEKQNDDLNSVFEKENSTKRDKQSNDLNEQIENKILIMNNKKEEKEIVFNEPSELFDFIVQNKKLKNMLNEQIVELIQIINSILYTPPYSILFGRASIDKEKSKSNEKISKMVKSINDLFFAGFGINMDD